MSQERQQYTPPSSVPTDWYGHMNTATSHAQMAAATKKSDAAFLFDLLQAKYDKDLAESYFQEYKKQKQGVPDSIPSGTSTSDHTGGTPKPKTIVKEPEGAGGIVVETNDGTKQSVNDYVNVKSKEIAARIAAGENPNNFAREISFMTSLYTTSKLPVAGLAQKFKNVLKNKTTFELVENMIGTPFEAMPGNLSDYDNVIVKTGKVPVPVPGKEYTAQNFMPRKITALARFLGPAVSGAFFASDLNDYINKKDKGQGSMGNVLVSGAELGLSTTAALSPTAAASSVVGATGFGLAGLEIAGQLFKSGLNAADARIAESEYQAIAPTQFMPIENESIRLTGRPINELKDYELKDDPKALNFYKQQGATDVQINEAINRFNTTKKDLLESYNKVNTDLTNALMKRHQKDWRSSGIGTLVELYADTFGTPERFKVIQQHINSVGGDTKRAREVFTSMIDQLDREIKNDPYNTSAFLQKLDFGYMLNDLDQYVSGLKSVPTSTDNIGAYGGEWADYYNAEKAVGRVRQ